MNEREGGKNSSKACVLQLLLFHKFFFLLWYKDSTRGSFYEALEQLNGKFMLVVHVFHWGFCISHPKQCRARTSSTAILKISTNKFVFEMCFLKNPKQIFKQCLTTFMTIFQKNIGLQIYFLSTEFKEKHNETYFAFNVHNSACYFKWLLHC